MGFGGRCDRRERDEMIEGQKEVIKGVDKRAADHHWWTQEVNVARDSGC